MFGHKITFALAAAEGQHARTGTFTGAKLCILVTSSNCTIGWRLGRLYVIKYNCDELIRTGI